MNIIQFLDECGGSRLKFQMLPACTVGASVRRRGGTEVRFITDALEPSDLLNKSRLVGVIVWVPRADYERAVAEAMREKGSDGREPDPN